MKKYFLIIAAMFSLLSCGPKEPAEPVKLSCDPPALNLDFKAATREVVITTDVAPTIRCSEKWCTVTLGSLAFGSLPSNKETMTISVTKNEGAQARVAEISIIGNKQSIIYKVTQDCEQVELTLSKTTSDFDSKGGSDAIVVTSSYQPEVSSSAPWCTAQVGKLDASKKADVSVVAGINLTDKDRSAVITLKSGSATAEIKVSQKAYSVETASVSAVTPEEFYEKFGMGWNMGNHFDANNNGSSSETAWGNAKCTQETFNAVKAAGFTSVRMPVTWGGHIGEAPDYKIEDKWLDRIAEAVGYCERAGLNVIVNMHHDGADSQYWLSVKDAAADSKKKTQIYEQFTQMWFQIAEKFKDKGDFLMFEPYNEIHDGGWGWSTDYRANPSKQNNVMNEWLQGFVKAVRLSGGENATRWLAAPGYCANLNFTIEGMKLPSDYTSNNRIAVAFHFYDPSDYTLECKFSEWGHTADPAKKYTADWNADEENVTYNLGRVKENYLDKGYPAYMGEMGNSFRSAARDKEFQIYYMEYVTKACHDYNVPPFVWDNGSKDTGRECHGYFDHGTGKFLNYAEEVVAVMKKAAFDTDPDYTLKFVYDNSAPAPAN